jgi:hypothetical protein
LRRVAGERARAFEQAEIRTLKPHLKEELEKSLGALYNRQAQMLDLSGLQGKATAAGLSVRIDWSLTLVNTVPRPEPVYSHNPR